jgi:hypothetical protein
MPFWNNLPHRSPSPFHGLCPWWKHLRSVRAIYRAAEQSAPFRHAFGVNDRR